MTAIRRVKRLFRRSLATILVVAVSLSTASCDNSNEPKALAGTYVATTFLLTLPGFPPLNVLAAGGTLTLTIAADMTTTGTLFVPGVITQEGDQSASLVGTAVQSGDAVTFMQTADTFVRDITFHVVGNTLQGSFTAPGDDGMVSLVLTRQ